MKKQKDSAQKPKTGFFRKIRKIVFWTLGSILILIALILLFLSVLFPNEKVKEVLADNLQNQLKREVTIQELDFNIFKGITLKGFEVKERKLFRESNPFFRIQSLKVDYSLLPLVFGRLVLNEATVKGAEVYVVVKNIDNRLRYNVDDLFQIPASSTEQTVEQQPLPEEKGEFAPPQTKKPALPLAFALGRVGVEDIKVNIRDYTNPVLTAEYTVDRVTALITNLTSGSNPFGIQGGLQVSLSEIKGNEAPQKNFNLYMGIDGKIKPFDEKGFLNPEAQIQVSVKDFMTHGGFLQTAINNGLKLALKEFIAQLDANLPQITEEIKKALKPKIDAQLANIEKKIDALKNSQGLSKEALIKEKEANLKEFDAKIGETLEKPMASILKQADSLPAAVKDQAKKEIQAQKGVIQKKSREALSKELDKLIASADKEYEKQMDNAKNYAAKQIDQAIGVAIKEAAKKLREWAVSLEKSGLGLGFLEGKIAFDGGGLSVNLKEWAFAMRDMDLKGADFGFSGSADMALVSGQGMLDILLFMNPKFDVIGLLEPFKKGDKIELPLKVSFNQKTGETKLNGSLISADDAKKYALAYAVGYAERLVGIGGSDTTASDNVEKYKEAMKKIREGNLAGAASEMGQAGEIVKKYQKAQETADKAKDAAKKTQDASKKIKKVF